MPYGWTDLPVRTYPEVDVYADLPSPSTVSGKIYVVKNTTGIWPLRKSAGFWLSDGATWRYLGDFDPAYIMNLYEANPTALGVTAVQNGENLGGGHEVFKQKDAEKNLEFRTMVAGAGQSIQTVGDTLVLRPLFSASASPGFTFGRDGPLVVGDWLLVDSAPSNKFGRPIQLTSPTITTASLRMGAADTASFEIYEHDGTTFTLKHTVSATASRAVDTTGLSVAITQGKELGVKVSAGSVSNGAGIVLTLSGGT